MVGYYPQLQDGELLYSATARLCAAIYPGKKMQYCTERLLGSSSFSFGVLIPNRANELLARIPAITQLTEEQIVLASTYHLHAPLLNDTERQALRDSIFGSDTRQGLRTFNARGSPTRLKYCLACARRDADLNQPQIWRVQHNHHGSVACAEHGTRLVITEAPVATSALCAPEDWIDLKAAPPSAATQAELAIARDLAWVYGQASKYTPGYKTVVAHLRFAMLSKSDFLQGSVSLDTSKVMCAVDACLSTTTLQMYSPSRTQLTPPRVFSQLSRTTLHAYSLYAFLSDTSLQALFTQMASVACSQSAPSDAEALRFSFIADRNHHRLDYHKSLILAYIAEHPLASRSHVLSNLPNSAEAVLKFDRNWYAQNMPPPLRHRRRPRVLCRNWEARDESLCTLANRYAAKGSPSFSSYRDAMRKLDLPWNMIYKVNGRLPKFAQLLQSMINDKKAA